MRYDEFQRYFRDGNANVSARVDLEWSFEVMDLAHACHMQGAVTGLFTPLAGIQTAGQWSLREGLPVFVLCKPYVRWREAVYEEAVQDFHEFGEQVLGSEDPNGVIGFGGKRFSYCGPQRIQFLRYSIETVGTDLYPTETMIRDIGERLALTNLPHGSEEREWMAVFAYKGTILVATTPELPTYDDLEEFGTLQLREERMFIDIDGKEHNVTRQMW